MKHMVMIMIVLLLLLTVTGCSGGEDIATRVGSGNNVDKVINELIDKVVLESGSDNLREAETESNSTDLGEVESESNYTGLEKQTSAKPKDGLDEQVFITEKSENNAIDVDYDLTNMSSDMVYIMLSIMSLQKSTTITALYRIRRPVVPKV